MGELLISGFEGIIKDGRSLHPEILEDHNPCHEEEANVLETIRLLSLNLPARNLFIHGSSGTGKTAMIKHVLNKAKHDYRNVRCVYVDCRTYPTSMAVYTKIADSLGESVSRRGRASDEILQIIIEHMKQSKIPLVVVLDELDGLFHYDDFSLLYNLSKIASQGVFFGVIGISDDYSALANLDSKISEVMSFVPLEVKKYDKDDLLEILHRKAEQSLSLGSYDDSIIEKIVEIGLSVDGNVRIALEILKNAALNAELAQKRKIEVSDILMGSKFIHTGDIDSIEHLILQRLESGQMTSSQIYSEFSRRLGKSKRQIKNYLRSLDSKGYITRIPVKIGNRIQNMIIKLKEG